MILNVYSIMIVCVVFVCFVAGSILGDKYRMTHPVGFRANKMISDFTGFHPVPGKLQDYFSF